MADDNEERGGGEGRDEEGEEETEAEGREEREEVFIWKQIIQCSICDRYHYIDIVLTCSKFNHAFENKNNKIE